METKQTDVVRFEKEFNEKHGNNYGACLKEIVEDCGTVAFQWRMNRITNKLAIIEISCDGIVFFEQK